MTVPEKTRMLAVVAAWMILLPLVFWVLGGAGKGTIFDWLARLLDTAFGIFGGPSLVIGFLIVAWIALQSARDAWARRGQS